MAVSAISAADPRTISAAAEACIWVRASGAVTASLIGNIIRQEKSPAFKEMGELVFSPHAYTMLNGGTACGTPMRRKGAAMAELSLCMIVKNEEARLARCLKSVCGAVDEIIILDTGSTDATKAIAREFTPSVYDYAWDDDFAAARNTSFAYAKRPFILWLDADDVLESSEREKLIALKRRLTADVDAVMMPYHTGFGAGLSLR